MQLFKSRVRKKCALTIHLIDLQTLNNEPKGEERKGEGRRIDDEENF